MVTVATLRRFSPTTGLPEDATSVTVGIIRDSDSAIILAAGTATTHPSTGVYTYDYSALLLSASLTYTLTWSVTVGAVVQPIIEKIEAADDAFTLAGLRRRLMETGRLGRYGRYTTTGLATGTDATKALIASELVDTDKNVTWWQGSYVLLTSGALAGQQRRVRQQGYTPTLGHLFMTAPFSDTVESGVTFEILTRLPATNANSDGVPGIREVINEVLRNTEDVDRLQFVATSDKLFYPVNSYPWLQREEQVGQVFGPLPSDELTTGTPELWPGGCWLRLDGEMPMIELARPFDTDEVFQVEVKRPYSTWIKTGGAWGESTHGLVADSDECKIDPMLLVELALAGAYRVIAGRCESADESKQWLMEAEGQERRAGRRARRRLPILAQVPARTMNPPRARGKSRGPRTLADLYQYPGLPWRR